MKKIILLFSVLIATGFTLNNVAQESNLSTQELTETIPPPGKSLSSIYIVQLTGDPVIAYEGGLDQMEATRPLKGKKLNSKSAHVKKYVGYLDQGHQTVLSSVGGTVGKIYDYRYSFNGFAAELTQSQVNVLKARSDVVNIWPNEIRHLTTDSSPNFLNLTEGGEPWSNGYVGEDVVIGMIDTGIQPDHPSLADVATPKKGNKGPLISYGEAPPGDWSVCEIGNSAFNPLDEDFECNNKLIKAQAFGDAFKLSNVLADGEFDSARDSDGHGTHTSTTAGGNNGVAAEINGVSVGSVSGIAPRARIAVYKVCWDADDGTGGCFSSDSMAAIDQAVADGVDVINFSIGGASTSFNGPDDVAFLFAANAGVWVATSQGNTGPNAQTTGTPAGVPWITSVGAAQDDQVIGTGVAVSSPVSIADNYLGFEGTGPVRLADTGDITNSVIPAIPHNGCNPLTNGADMTGNIALVIRGACSFSSKYSNAAAAGAIAIVVYNDGTGPTRLDPISMGGLGSATIPGVMIGFVNGDLINTTANGGEIVTATVGPNVQISLQNRIAVFSSRGPNGGASDIIKPDVAAPGVAIIAGETLFPNVNAGGGQLFQSISGTSMASPHVAGTFALLKQAHPDWSAAMARSALMTTARQNLKKTFGETAADPFDIGAGHIVPDAAFDPGLAYDANIVDYVRFTCGAIGQPPIFSAGTCNFFGSIDSSDLNLASIGIADLVGSQTITRTVTNVANNSGNKSFYVSIDAPPGIDVSVSPTSIKLNQGESASYQVTFSVNNSVVFDQWAFGSLTWTHGAEYSVRSPIAVKPKKLNVEPEVSASGVVGSADVNVEFGYSGTYNAMFEGMAERIRIASGNVNATTDTQDTFCIGLPALSHLRVTSRDADTTNPGQDDVDLRLFVNSSCSFAGAVQVGASAGPTSEEVMDVVNSQGGVYIPVVDYFAAGVGDNINYTLNFTLVSGDEGNASITSAPASATAGTTGTVKVDYAGLNPNSRYLGVVIHKDQNGEIKRSLIDVNTQ